jgi:hypothetical protein
MKVAKEQIVGMVAAVDWFLGQSDAGLEAEFRSRALRIAAHLQKAGAGCMDGGRYARDGGNDRLWP